MLRFRHLFAFVPLLLIIACGNDPVTPSPITTGVATRTAIRTEIATQTPPPAVSTATPVPSTATPVSPTLSPILPTLTLSAQQVKATTTAIARATKTGVAAGISADKTLTANAKRGVANATATAVKFASYAITPPGGTFTNGTSDMYINCNLQYLYELGYNVAGKGSKWVAVSMKITNTGTDTLYVNPLYLSLVSTAGETVAIDVNTYDLSKPLQSVELAPNRFVTGAVAFYVGHSFIPGTLVWKSLDQNLEVPIVQTP